MDSEVIVRVLALADKWDGQGDRFGLGYYQECARELRDAIEGRQ